MLRSNFDLECSYYDHYRYAIIVIDVVVVSIRGDLAAIRQRPLRFTPRSIDRATTDRDRPAVKWFATGPIGSVRVSITEPFPPLIKQSLPEPFYVFRPCSPLTLLTTRKWHVHLLRAYCKQIRLLAVRGRPISQRHRWFLNHIITVASTKFKIFDCMCE